MTTIHHTVFFRLQHERGSLEEKEFFVELDKLRDIPGVNAFQHVKEVSPKNNFDFGLMMEFASQHEYDRYNNHPLHVTFVEEVWLPQVAEHLELDFVST